MKTEHIVSDSPKKKNRKPLIIGGVVLVVALFIVVRFVMSMHREKTDNAQLDAMITPVRVVVPGFITEIRFHDNQIVKRGDTLAIIDRRDYIAKLDQAAGALESAKAQLEIAQTGVVTANADAKAGSLNSDASQVNISAAQARLTKAEREMARLEKMLADEAATQQQYDAGKAEYETAKAQLAMANRQAEAAASQAEGASSRVQTQKSQIGLSGAIVKQREAEYALAQRQLDNTIITAPFDGIISRKSIETGQYVQAGVPVCSAVDISHLYVSANFKETQIEDMRPGQEAQIHIDAFPNAKIRGVIESFGGATGAKFSLLPPDNSTGNFVKITQRVPVRIAIKESPEDLKGLLLPGLSAVVEIKTN